MNRCEFAPALRALVAACGMALAFAPSPASAQNEPIRSKPIELGIDSGRIDNDSAQPRVVWSDIIEARGAGWLRLYFNAANLDPDLTTAASSTIRIMSLQDGAVQDLDAWTVQQWGYSTAYFNGEKLSIELIARPHSRGNRIALSQVDVGIHEDIVGPASICGATDDRMLSTDARSARALPIGCTAWIIDDPNHQFISAGHCTSTSLQVLEFNVPLSGQEGNLIHPPPQDQYAVDPLSRQRQDGGVGQDWGYFGVFRNTQTGLSAFQVQGEYHVLASAPPAVNGQTINITGYGTTGSGVPREWNQVQKVHTGSYHQFSGTTVRYRVDTSGGNSGSCVLDETTGMAIGVHTHAGCNSDPNSSNQGTGINNSGWQNALAHPAGVCAPFTLNAPTLNAGQPATFDVPDASPGQRVYFIYSLAGQGETLVAQLGVTLGILNPQLGGSAIADGSGRASLTKVIPGNARGLAISIQAAEAGRCSAVVTRQVN